MECRAPGFNVTATGKGLALSGEVDMANAEALVNALRSAQEDVWLGSEVILDLSELSFIDSNGVRIIAEAARAMAPGRRLVIRSAPLSFLRIAQIFNLDRESGLILEGIE